MFTGIIKHTGKINKISNFKKHQFLKLISTSLKKVMRKLAQQIVCDGEGISKLIEVKVSNAKNKTQAKKIAFSISETLKKFRLTVLQGIVFFTYLAMELIELYLQSFV